MTSTHKESDGVIRGKLLEVAIFLTTFQSHFCPESFPSTDETNGERSETTTPGPAPGIVSPQDIENALEYRELLIRVQELEDEKYVMEQYLFAGGHAEARHHSRIRRQRDRIDDQLEQVQLQLEKRTEKEKSVLRLLTRFEVWSTKAISQNVFIHPENTALEYQ